ncbi:DNA-3-methyladenine glycosylase I [Leucobacter sp. USHLN153]|uniref:DNA-3-methyladenine glycosylase I n=1 Tax=Leucobacter sp. USHLN153 TaxID=3081268 RepID=UPI003018BF39
MTTNSGTVQRAAWATQDPLLTEYYDTEWGMPLFEDDEVFERLSLEAFQSGLSWLTVLRKREAFRESFAGFSIERVAAFDDADIERLLMDARLIRNRRKIVATISNARAAIRLREETGAGIAEWVWRYQPERSPAPRTEEEVPSVSPESRELAKELKRRGFSFVGPTTVYALMTAIGIADAHLLSSHRRGCSGLWAAGGSRTELPLPFTRTFVAGKEVVLPEPSGVAVAAEPRGAQRAADKMEPVPNRPLPMEQHA